MSARKLWEAGYQELVSVVPPKAELAPTTTLKPESRGKAPGIQRRDGLWVGYSWVTTDPPTEAQITKWDKVGARWRRHFSRLEMGGQSMRYAEIYTIVDGALDREIETTDYLLAGAFVADVAREATDGYETAVFVIMHEHEPGECECVQYLTDHKPTWTFPADGLDDESEYAAYFA